MLIGLQGSIAGLCSTRPARLVAPEWRTPTHGPENSLGLDLCESRCALPMRIVIEITSMEDAAGTLCSGIRSGFRKQGAGLELTILNRCRTALQTDREPDVERLDGAILIGTRGSALRKRMPESLPWVLVAGGGHPGTQHRNSLCVLPDDEAVGRLAGEHAAAAGYRLGLVSVDLEAINGHTVRAKAFLRRCHQAGMKTGNLRELARAGDDPRATLSRQMRWLARQEQPAVVFFAQDAGADWFRAQCCEHGLAVPDPIGIIGVDNSDVYCEVVEPTLTSVDLPFHHMGEMAAELLVEALRRSRDRSQAITVPPLRVVARRSTARLRPQSRLIRAFDAYLQEHLSENLTGEGVAETLGVAYITLWRACKKELGKSPLDYLRDLRLGEAERLLLTTSRKVDTVAKACGFASARSFSSSFSERYGLTPVRFRLTGRSRDEEDDPFE